MKIEWQDDGDLRIQSAGCYDCTGEVIYLTPEDFDDLLKHRPVIIENQKAE